MDSKNLFSGSYDELSSQSAYSLNHNRELIFIESLKELETRIGNKTPYSLVRKASVLRLLLISDSKYYPLINKNYNLKITFNYRIVPNEIESINVRSEESKIFTTNRLIFDESIENQSIDVFLSQVVMKNHNPTYTEFLELNHIEKEYSVCKIINLIANAHGGVHLEKKWKGIINENVIYSDETSPFNINFNSKLHEIIDDISIICLESLRPLVEKIKTQKTKPIELILKKNIQNEATDKYLSKIDRIKIKLSNFIKKLCSL